MDPITCLRMRKSLGMTQATVARQVGIDRHTLGKFEAGENPNITDDQMARLASVLGFTSAQLLHTAPGIADRAFILNALADRLNGIDNAALASLIPVLDVLHWRSAGVEPGAELRVHQTDNDPRQ